MPFLKNIFMSYFSNPFAIIMVIALWFLSFPAVGYSLLLQLLEIFGIITWIWGARYVIKRLNWNYTEDTVIGHHYEATISSDGTIDTKEVNDWSDNGSWFKFAMAGITFPFWSLFHLLYLLVIKKHILNKINCPKEIKIPLDNALKNTINVSLSKSDIKKYETARETYYNKIANLKSKYDRFGNGGSQEKLNRITMPICHATCTEILNNKKSRKNVVLAAMKEDFYFILYVENNKPIGKVIFENHYLYFDNDIWKNNFEKTINSFQNNENLYKEMSKFLIDNPNKLIKRISSQN